MEGLRIGDVARPLPPLALDDTVARAAEHLRSVPFGVLPVVENGRVVGVVSLEALADATRAVLQGIAPAEEIRLAPLRDGLLSPVEPLRGDGSLHEAARALHGGARALPVVDGGGRYLGVLNQADLAGVVCRAERPPTIGGMATPLGVYLTTGTLSAGARGSPGLILTGAAMAAGFLVAWVLAGYLMLGLERATGIPLRAALASPPVGFWNLNPYDIWQHLPPLFAGVIFAALLRLSPLAGFHAAEHQVVHAVEQDRPLTPEQVARMPRAHPRCGTRLVAVVVLIALFGVVLPVSDPTARTVAAVIAVLIWWRKLGMRLQDWVTTRPATPGQIRSAIDAADALLAKHRSLPYRRPTFWRRIWHMGLPQVLAGGSLAQALLIELAGRYHLPLYW
ncbi:MAG: DUF1385 domain-containing protein [Armatimonadetes bacterium]|nr:DUF1385 domain-containing protein [Armatimonadota bacterium]